MKSLTSLWSCLAMEMAKRCCTSATQDIKTVLSRTEHEGLWFLAVTLADYGKAIQKWLDHGQVVPSDVSSFKLNRSSGESSYRSPCFLQGFLGRVFSPVDGALLDEPDIEAIYALQQLTLLFSKIAPPKKTPKGSSSVRQNLKVSAHSRERQAMSDYIQCEQDVRTADANLDPQFLEDFRSMSTMLFGDVFDEVENKIYYDELIPKHGPGAVADRLTSNGKWNQRSWPARLMEHFAPQDFLITNCKSVSESYPVEQLYSELDILEPGAEIPVRVITVPKTLKTPRIIAIEPTAMQYAQQSILRAFLETWKQDSFLSRVIGFDDQDPNRDLARSGSLSGELATLDLSEASDRVSNQHVLALLSDYPLLLGAIQACRSRKADVPGHGVIRLSKFASMGSALCFPIEAMVFLTIIFMGIQAESNAPLSRDTLIKRYRRQVRVFGDDIIVPKDNVLSVVDKLHAFGYVVNISKSFWTGRFRESCGRQYFNGEDVSVVRVREMLPTQRQDASAVISAVSLRNQLYWAGCWETVVWLDDFLGKLMKHYPIVAPTSALLGRESVLGYQFQRLDPNTHSPLTKGFSVSAESPLDKLEGPGALLKCLIRMLDKEDPLIRNLPSKYEVDYAKIADSEHLERSGRPKHVSIKLGWRSPF